MKDHLEYIQTEEVEEITKADDIIYTLCEALVSSK